MIYLVRHGETAYNRDGVTLGRADVPLTELGRLQAVAVGEKLAGERIARILTSPLERSAAVALEIARHHGLEPERREELTELDVGETEGLAFAEMRRRFPDFLVQWTGPEGWRAVMPGGESLEDVAERLQGLRPLIEAAHDDGLVVVSHNFTLRLLICQLLGLEIARFRSFEIGLATVTTLVMRNGRFGVRSMNDPCHLSNLNLA